ncbi:GAP family protein [Actinomycetospora termitidis]|uniref:GAP family protein n=1 Tax=Actinomycetospora termitidis TaxID=3053470 RepID=A0ABT7MHB4_9PSEU|nr:GAP family protein [Actinomycetospora sp. Odt1-22]MDL5160068.1 GAP family protein [Actinomycetospora sp. Odt1-22]
MSIEALILGLLSAVRATPLAIVSGFLLSRDPRRPIAAYVVTGIAVSLAVGAVVVLWLGPAVGAGDPGDAEASAGRQIVDLVLGVGAVGYAAGYASGRLAGRGGDRRPGRVDALLARLREPSIPIAAAAGALTNLPGLFYVAGLVAILETGAGPVGAMVQVVVYTVLRLGGPAAVLVLCVTRPRQARSATDAVRDWAVRHRRILVPGVLGVLGLYLAAKGLVGLLS